MTPPDSSSVSPDRNPDREAASEDEFAVFATPFTFDPNRVTAPSPSPVSPEAPPTAPAWRCAECRGLFPEPTGPFERYTRRERVLCPACVINGLDSELDTIVEILGIEGSDKSISQSVREMASALDEARAVASSPEGLPARSFEKLLEDFWVSAAKVERAATNEERMALGNEVHARRSALIKYVRELETEIKARQISVAEVRAYAGELESRLLTAEEEMGWMTDRILSARFLPEGSCGFFWRTDYGPAYCDQGKDHKGMHRCWGSQGGMRFDSSTGGSTREEK